MVAHFILDKVCESKGRETVKQTSAVRDWCTGCDGSHICIQIRDRPEVLEWGEGGEIEYFVVSKDSALTFACYHNWRRFHTPKFLIRVPSINA